MNPLVPLRSRLAEARRSVVRSEDGFTLIELLVVVVIIGVLIAIAIPLYLNYQRGANDKSAHSDVRNAIGVLEICKTDNTTYPTALGTAAGLTYNAMTGCTGQQVNYTKNTTLNYTYTAASGSTPASYMITGINSGGTKTYCYNSSKGGSVLALVSPATTC